MKIEHLAIWTQDLERLRDFYETYFGGQANEKYVNPKKGFSSYFLSFEGGPRLELMHMPGIPPTQNDPESQFTGLIHVAFEVADRSAVDQLADRFRQSGYPMIDGPRITGDGYYEFTILDPDRNRIEVGCVATPTSHEK
jgi:lactoylglutathione lyase